MPGIQRGEGLPEAQCWPWELWEDQAYWTALHPAHCLIYKSRQLVTSNGAQWVPGLSWWSMVAAEAVPGIQKLYYSRYSNIHFLYFCIFSPRREAFIPPTVSPPCQQTPPWLQIHFPCSQKIKESFWIKAEKSLVWP